ncbi:MAG TPA: glycosyltransferase family 2 protein [Firmicutes bacterium]|nr:glycosyltransferase family 2 protein [Peptococcaceae bacterium MAG4]NLW39264.1 glycosyltransferase family 2 protein [Peptococcaceae bacterium]HAA33796.1 glycosyltransferase family 2 protein [Bacillota bacterium]HPZ42866.1 glycosyltransferase family 2 protein [Bacillota bacterium]
MKKKYSITIFFPCYNEEHNIERVTREALDVAGRLFDDYEIIIVNDGSRDNTGAIADRLAKENPFVRVIHHEHNKGYGAALRTGFENATKELVFYTDGDGQFKIEEITKLLPLIDKYDIVSGYRIRRQDSLIRKINAFMWGLLVNALFKINVSDVDSAFKLYKRKIFDEITLTSQGALIDTEIFAKARAKGYTITEVGVNHYPRVAGEQTGAKLSVIFKAFKELFKLRSSFSPRS